jgi:hypothetical protein
MNAFAISRMSDEYLAIAAEEAKGSRVSRQKAQWRKLKADFLKINTDGVYKADFGSGG